jgi:UDP-N-acetylmuramate--alanine ligase
VLAIPEKKIRAALGLYTGAWRRMEHRGDYHGVVVYDDYAHHPTEIKATLQGFREKYPDKKLICVFQPHQAKRLAKLFNDFSKSFIEADAVVILPLYKVPGRDEKTFPDRDAKALAKKVQKYSLKKSVLYLNDPKRLKTALAPLLSPGSILIMMGAGDIMNYTSSLLS